MQFLICFFEIFSEYPLCITNKWCNFFGKQNALTWKHFIFKNAPWNFTFCKCTKKNLGGFYIYYIPLIEYIMNWTWGMDLHPLQTSLVTHQIQTQGHQNQARKNAHVRLDQIHHHLLAILIGKRLCIGVGFGHKILAWTWSNVKITSKILCVHIMDGNLP